MSRTSRTARSYRTPRTARTSHFRLAAALAVTASLSLTVGSLAAGPAGAVTGAGVAASTSDTVADVPPFPKDAYIWGSGPEGYGSRQYTDSDTTSIQRWTRHRDGVTTVLPAGTYGYSAETDIVPQVLGGGRYAMHDMSTGTVLELDLNPLGAGYTIASYAGADIVARKVNATGGTDLHVIGKRAGVLFDDAVTGFPADAVIGAVSPQGPDIIAVRYSATVNGSPQNRLAVVDIASHAVVERYDLPATATGNIDVSATRIAWVEKPSQFKSVAAVTPRGTTATVRYDLGAFEHVTVRMVGDWLTYARSENSAQYPFRVAAPLMARSLTATGAPVTLLDNTVLSASSADGSLMVRGGTFTQGEGLYRIDPRDGATRPPVALVASTGDSTNLTLVSQAASGTFALDQPGTPKALGWKLSYPIARVSVELTHKATKRTWTHRVYAREADEVYRFPWVDPTRVGGEVPLPNGDYTWRLRGTYFDPNGPALDRTGSFKIVRKTVPHDFNDNGAPDPLMRTYDGRLVLYNIDVPSELTYQHPPEIIGSSGWNTYDQLLTPGHVGGTPYPDLVARDKTGALWLHQGTGRAFSTRVKIGWGWNIYTQLTAGGDFTSNGKPDLLGVDKAGGLWLHKGTGDATRPFTSPTKVGTGYNTYNKIVATGNLAGSPAGDLVGRDKDGVLWLHLGKGDGTFGTRTRIGAGWNQYKDVVGIGDLDRDGRADLLTGINSSLYFYKGTGDSRAPFKPGIKFYIADGWSPVF
ncbi:VCBS repeat-containing protein [Streptomyces sp. NPDC020807]|uniref:FG-GAP repeat domain-containing protein n=1 Tax=Streptomyces sp. NPDC020807 TaxID=3155119 RepID=UPI0033F8F576